MEQTLGYSRARLGRVLLVCMLAGCTGSPRPGVPPVAGAPGLPAAHGANEMVVAANPLATAAGLEVLHHGGTAVDAAVAVQAVLGLVEPQSSGPGGGSVLLTWREADGGVRVFEGTPRAGRNAPPGLNAGDGGQPLDPRMVEYGGAAVGVPGTLPALFAAHAAQGKLPWAALFAPAIALADGGFPMPRALHDVLAAPGALAAYGPVAAPWLGPDGTLPPVGATLRNPAYADTLRRVAASGPGALYDASGLPRMMDALARGLRPSLLTAEDLSGFAAATPAPLCAAWQAWRVCTAPPPSYGGLAALQTLEMVGAMAGTGDLDEPEYAHAFLEASRLAQADRRRYLGDPDFVPVPDAGLLDPTYLAARAGLIAPAHAMARPPAGDPARADAARAPLTDDPGAPTTATSQVVVVDRAGDVVTMTTTLSHVFGARLLAGGVVLNNALANFAPMPPQDSHYANEMAPGKRPIGPLAPVIVLDAAGRPVLLGGSGGGPGVPDFVAAALLDILVRHRSPAEALARGHISAADPDHIAVEAGTQAEALLPALAAMDHPVRAERLPSGSAFVLRRDDGWVGAADPRRDGVALGD